MLYRFLALILIFLAMDLLLVWATETRPKRPEPKNRMWHLVRSIPHPAPSYTQGLLWHHDALFESVGLYGSSEVRELDATTGALRHRRMNSAREFGEGLAMKDDELVQLTYREGYALRYTRKGLNPIHPRWTITTEGWGLTWMPDRQRFARSDGSARIRFHRATDFKEDASIEVRRAGVALRNINELEYARGNLYANIWGTNAQAQRVIEIDPLNGDVIAEIDFSALCKREHVAVNQELNGIAYNPDEDVFYITGKGWKYIYVVRF